MTLDNRIKDNRTKRLLISNILFRSGILISNIFLNIFLFKNTNDISLIALFNIISLITQLLSFSFFARIVKFGHRNLFHIIALIGLSLMYFNLVLLGNNIIHYNIIFAIGIGFFIGIYWIVYNNNEFDLTSIANRGNFQGLKKSLKTLIAIIIPSLIGIIIGINFLGYGYELSFLIGVVFFLLSAFIGIIKIDYTKETKFSMKIAIAKIIKNKNLMKISLNYSLLGFSLSNPLIDTVLPLLLFTYGIKEMDLGFLVSLFAILTIIFSYLFGKFVNYNNYKLSYIISGFFYTFSVFILLFFPSYWYVILFVSVLSLLFSLMDIPQNVFSANIFHNISGYEEIKSEYMVIREWPLMIGRILSFTCIYFIGEFDVLGIKILFAIMALIILCSVYLFSTLKINKI